MNILEVLKIAAALLNIGFGVYVVLYPETIARYSHFSVDNARGRAEIRIAMGGFFIGMGVGALLLGSLANLDNGNIAYQVVGFAWLGGGITRLLNLTLEDTQEIVDASFWGLLASELMPGLILILPASF